MEVKISPLSDYFAEVVEPRKAKGLRHPLVALLNLCCVALMSGAKTPKAIANWWRNRQDCPELLQRLGFTQAYGPSQSTIYAVLALVTVALFEAKINQWLEDNFDRLPSLPAGELEGMAIDGKKLRQSHQQGAVISHLLSVLSHRLSVTIAQLGITDQTNEIGMMPELLANLVIAGRVFTMDAQHTQKRTAQTLLDHDGDYVMVVKQNQKTLYADLDTLFRAPEAAALIHQAVSQVNAGHGRIETRILQTSQALNDFVQWPGVQQVFRLERRTIIKKSGRVRTQIVYGLTSLSSQQADATALLKLTRQHWHIENKSHYIRDVTFGEDASMVRKGNLPQMMAALRNCALTLIRLHPFRFIPDAFDFFATHPFMALEAIGC